MLHRLHTNPHSRICFGRSDIYVSYEGGEIQRGVTAVGQSAQTHRTEHTHAHMHTHSGCDACDLIQDLAESSVVLGLDEVVPNKMRSLQLSAPYTHFHSLLLFVSASLSHLSCSPNVFIYNLLPRFRRSPASLILCIYSGLIRDKSNGCSIYVWHKPFGFPRTHTYTLHTHIFRLDHAMPREKCDQSH